MTYSHSQINVQRCRHISMTLSSSKGFAVSKTFDTCNNPSTSDKLWRRSKFRPLLTFYPSSWAASSEFGTYRLCEQRRFRRTCESAQSRQNLRCSLIQAVSQEEPSDRKPDHDGMTQIRLAGLIWLLMQRNKLL